MMIIIFLLVFFALVYAYISVRYWYFRKPLQENQLNEDVNEVSLTQPKTWKDEILNEYMDPSPVIFLDLEEFTFLDKIRSAGPRWISAPVGSTTITKDQKHIPLSAWFVYLQKQGEAIVRLYYSRQKEKYLDIILREKYALMIPRTWTVWTLISKKNVSGEFEQRVHHITDRVSQFFLVL